MKFRLFWVGFGAKFKPSILKQDNGVWFSNFEMPVMLSVNQAAEGLGISNVSLYKLIEKDKSFPVVQLGRRKSIPKEQLKEWIDENLKDNYLAIEKGLW